MHLFAPPQDVTSPTQHILLDLVTTIFGKEKNHDAPYVSTGFHHGVRASLFWDVTQWRMVAITDVSGQPIGPETEVYSLHVLGSHVHIIRRITVSMQLLVLCYFFLSRSNCLPWRIILAHCKCERPLFIPTQNRLNYSSMYFNICV